MRRPRDVLLVFVLAFSFCLASAIALAAPEPAASAGSVTLPLSRLRALEQDLDVAPYLTGGPDALWIGRRVDGRFRKGLFTGRLVARFEVPRGGLERVPVLDRRAVIGDVTLDGAPASLVEDKDRYALPVEREGRHELTVDFHWGRETERFTRTLDFTLPEGGPVEVEARIAERGITPSLASGVLSSFSEQGGETLVSLHLDGAGAIRLSWKQSEAEALSVDGWAAGSAEGRTARIEAREHALFRVSDALVAAEAAFDLHVLEGETNLVRFTLPPGLEILRVHGDAVLQWHTLAGEGEPRALVVRLRHLVTEDAAIRVEFQVESEPGAPIELAMPMLDGGAPTRGDLGIVGPPGLRIEPLRVEHADSLTAREIPKELQDLGGGPLLFGYRFERAPRIVVSASPLPALELARTVVDELSASTLVLEDGTERTKLALRIRNDGRQYVELALPEGARPMRSFIDGREVRPAILGQRLLLPLQQSERLGEGKARVHVVRPGETLSDVANLYYSDPSAWQRILSKNRGVVDPSGSLVEGSRLEIPAEIEAAEEASFIIEVAYERAIDALGVAGTLALRLPGVDVDTTKAVWHVYVPASYEPLAFHGNLTQISRIKYDPLRRLQWYLQSALGPSVAWAGGDYENILTKRRAIFNDEAARGGESFAALSEFPLVGQQVRFRRVLLGREIPRLELVYASNGALGVLRALATGAAFFALFFALRRRGRAPLVVLAASLLLLLALAHFIPGVHRRIVWGLDLALLVLLARRALPRLRRLARAFARAPWLLPRVVTARRLVAALGFTWLLGALVEKPMLLSITALAVLSAAWFFSRREGGRLEVRHAS